jgi:hypothetical protein
MVNVPAARSIRKSLGSLEMMEPRAEKKKALSPKEAKGKAVAVPL